MSDTPTGDNDLLDMANAAVWAKRFVGKVASNPAIATDEGAMLAWFACAIETGRRFGRDSARRDLAALRGPTMATDPHAVDALRRRIAQARTPEFMARLATRMREDAAVLDRLRGSDSLAFTPCPSRGLGVLGFDKPTEVPCGGPAGHDGDHYYAMTWGDSDA